MVSASIIFGIIGCVMIYVIFPFRHTPQPIPAVPAPVVPPEPTLNAFPGEPTEVDVTTTPQNQTNQWDWEEGEGDRHRATERLV